MPFRRSRHLPFFAGIAILGASHDAGAQATCAQPPAKWRAHGDADGHVRVDVDPVAGTWRAVGRDSTAAICASVPVAIGDARAVTIRVVGINTAWHDVTWRRAGDDRADLPSARTTPPSESIETAGIDVAALLAAAPPVPARWQGGPATPSDASRERRRRLVDALAAIARLVRGSDGLVARHAATLAALERMRAGEPVMAQADDVRRLLEAREVRAAEDGRRLIGTLPLLADSVRTDRDAGRWTTASADERAALDAQLRAAADAQAALPALLDAADAIDALAARVAGARADTAVGTLAWSDVRDGTRLDLRIASAARPELARVAGPPIDVSLSLRAAGWRPVLARQWRALLARRLPGTS